MNAVKSEKPVRGERREAGEACRKPLKTCIGHHLERYFADLNGHAPKDLYALVLREIEVPLLQVVLRNTDNNQTRAAEALGISRSTLRKKLRDYGLDK